MKKIIGLSFILFASIMLYGCTDVTKDPNIEITIKRETGDGNFKLLTPTITTEDNQLEFITEGIDENRVTFIYVANKKVFEQKIINDESYKLNIMDIKDAHRTDYKPKVQLFQTIDDTEDGDIVTFKQVRYKVK